MTNKEIKVGDYYHATAGKPHVYTMRVDQAAHDGRVLGPFLSADGERFSMRGSFSTVYSFEPADEKQKRWLASCINAGKLVPEPESEPIPELYEIY